MMENDFGQPVGPSVLWQPALLPPRTPMRGTHVTLEPLDLAQHGDALWSAFGLHAGQAAADHEARAKAWTYLSIGPFEQRGAFDEAMAALAALEGFYFFAVVPGGSGAAAGFLSLMEVKPAAGSVEVGFVAFSPSLQRSAASTEALFLVMHRAMGEGLGYRRLEWKCDALNAKSASAAARLGFTHEGTFRQCTVYKGRSRDTAWFSLLDGEWPAVAAAFKGYLAAGNFDESGAQLRPLRAFVAVGGQSAQAELQARAEAEAEAEVAAKAAAKATAVAKAEREAKAKAVFKRQNRLRRQAEEEARAAIEEAEAVATAAATAMLAALSSPDQDRT
jgi:RimJ/RimL family protein N-acetyltransferase